MQYLFLNGRNIRDRALQHALAEGYRGLLLTGRYPFRYGLQTMVIPGTAGYGLDTSEWLLPQCLKEAGYRTAIIGKWHLGHADKKYWPRQRGFDYQYGAMIGELDYFTHDEHGVLDIDPALASPQLGDRVWLIPGHCDPTVNLHEHYVVVRGGLAVERWNVAARARRFTL
mgnify:CR=1 FL=1